MSLTSRQLFALGLAAIGARVAYSDGTPRPPERFNKKLRDWQRRNGTAVFVGFQPSKGEKEWDKDSFTVRTLDSDTIVMNMTHHADGTVLTWDVTPPAPGTVLAMQDGLAAIRNDGGAEAKHVFENEAALYAWGDRNRYSPLKQTEYGTRYVVIGENGEHLPYTPTR